MRGWGGEVLKEGGAVLHALLGRCLTTIDPRMETGVLIWCLLAFVVRPLVMHPFRDGAPLVLLTETPSTSRRSLSVFRVLRLAFCFNPIPFPVSPYVATIYLLGNDRFLSIKYQVC